MQELAVHVCAPCRTQVKWHVYGTYLRAFHLGAVTAMVVFYASEQGTRIATNAWLAHWSREQVGEQHLLVHSVLMCDLFVVIVYECLCPIQWCHTATNAWLAHWSREQVGEQRLCESCVPLHMYASVESCNRDTTARPAHWSRWHVGTGLRVDKHSLANRLPS